MTRWMPTLVFAALAAGFAAAVAPISGQDAKPVPVAEVASLTAESVEAAPELSSELTEAWSKLTPLKVPTTLGDKEGPTVELRAVHDAGHIYIFARWADATESHVKKAWSFQDGKWTKLKGDEDRIAFAFNINSDLFAKEGCAGICHYGDFRVTEKGGKVDIWHWKAARGGRFSHADDQRITDAEENARGDDAGKGCYGNNKNEDDTAPAYVWKKDADTRGAFNADSSTPLTGEFEPPKDYSVPSILLRAPDGSRGDIEARGAYKDGHWQVMLKRKLDTGHDDDAVFKVGEELTFSVSLFDDTGTATGDDHATSRALKLVLKGK
ncbi:MAG: hypothetical protein H6840_12295 [Planctomycetes bacterium]|nr:hypothetical protein [Planctomycetota bacterium]